MAGAKFFVRFSQVSALEHVRFRQVYCNTFRFILDELLNSVIDVFILVPLGFQRTRDKAFFATIYGIHRKHKGYMIQNAHEMQDNNLG